jgi:hypothetical protein
MASEQSERDRLIIALRRDLPLVILAGLGLWGYLDLRGRIDRSSEREVMVASVEPAPVKTDEVVAQEEPPAQPAEQPPTPPAPSTTWGCAGKVSNEELARVLEAHGGSVVECYRGMLSVTQAEGTYILVLQVGADGSVLDVLFGGTLRNEQLDECVVRALADWKFTPFEGGGCAIAQVPYVLNPENAFN